VNAASTVAGSVTEAVTADLPSTVTAMLEPVTVTPMTCVPLRRLGTCVVFAA
jgi:hypothetical protein